MYHADSVLWMSKLWHGLHELMTAAPVSFSDLTPAKVPVKTGVYLVMGDEGEGEEPYYIGRSGNLQERLYRNHLMGNEQASSLKKHVIADGRATDKEEAKQFLQRHCTARWIEVEEPRSCSALEAFCTAILTPKYNIKEER